MVELPPIVPGVAGVAADVTANVWAGDAPQLLLAVTVMFPLDALAVEVIELVVEVPVQPLGNAQV